MEPMWSMSDCTYTHHSKRNDTGFPTTMEIPNYLRHSSGKWCSAVKNETRSTNKTWSTTNDTVKVVAVEKAYLVYLKWMLRMATDDSNFELNSIECHTKHK